MINKKIKEDWKKIEKNYFPGLYALDNFYGLEISYKNKTGKLKNILLRIKAFFLNLVLCPWVRFKVERPMK